MGLRGLHAASSHKSLLSADLRGVDDRVWREAKWIHKALGNQKNKYKKPNMKVVYETPSAVVGDGGLGLRAGSCTVAMEIAIEKTKTAGTRLDESNLTFGMVCRTLMALEPDMIGIPYDQCKALCCPTFSVERMLRHLDCSLFLPVMNRPLAADFATTTTSNGKLENFAKEK